MKTKFLTLIAFFLFTLTVTQAKQSGDPVYNFHVNMNAFYQTLQINLSNYTDKRIVCRGTINAWTQNRQYKTYFYNQIIPARGSDFRTFNLWDRNDSFSPAPMHFIRCFEY